MLSFLTQPHWDKTVLTGDICISGKGPAIGFRSFVKQNLRMATVSFLVQIVTRSCIYDAHYGLR